ncbi:dephospho-CoA kinase [Candidatus Peregrinibacteria bacterium]|nr:MAG: dephospho-CoA kinase [Candidatus Peregrinibacteria bacterium]
MILGIVGMIGSGKSTYARQYNAEHFSGKAKICEADSIGHEILKNTLFQNRLRNQFGNDIFSSLGNIDRNVLREKACRSASALSDLEKIVHPLLKKELLHILRPYRKTEDVLFMVVALPFSLGLFEYFDEYISLSVEKEEAWIRIQNRSPNISRKQFEVFWKRQEREYSLSDNSKNEGIFPLI